MQTVNIFTRTTRQYRDGYSSLDNFDFLATVKMTPPKVVREATDYDDGGAYMQYVRVPRGVDAKALAQGIRDTIGGSNCKHDYDCCGCASRRVSTKLLTPRKLQVRTSVTYNY